MLSVMKNLLIIFVKKGAGGNFLRLLVSMCNDLCSCVKTSARTCTDVFDCNIAI